MSHFFRERTDMLPMETKLKELQERRERLKLGGGAKPLEKRSQEKITDRIIPV